MTTVECLKFFAKVLMPSRAIFKGTIRFDDLSIPVKLYTAISEQKVSFHLLHDQDKQHLRQQMVCTAENVPVGTEHIIKGFEIEQGRYVEFAPEELDALEPETSRQLEIIDFVDAGDVDPRYFDRCYYLGPDGLNKHYAAVAATLHKTNKIGICRWVMRKHHYLGALRSTGKLLELVVMRFADEVIEPSSVSVGEAATTEKELQMAGQLIEMLENDFHPQDFHNDFQQRLRDLIEQKARGRKITVIKEKPAPATRDRELTETLQASIEQVRRKREKAHVAK